MGLQYILVFIILAACIGWIAYKLLFKQENGDTGGCCGCALSEKCTKPTKKKRDKTACKDKNY